MSYQLATLVWWLLLAAAILSGFATVVSGFAAAELEKFRLVFMAIGFLFLTIILAWGAWAIYPLGAMFGSQ